MWRKTFAKWVEIKKMLENTVKRASDVCALCATYEYCEDCPASADNICGTSGDCLYEKFIFSIIKALNLCDKILDWIEEEME